MADVRRAVRNSFSLANLKRGDRILLGVSGGADSMALASAAAFEGPRAGIEVYALVVDHGLQADSAEFTAIAVSRLQGLSISVDSVRVQVSGTGGTENAARDARLAALVQHAQANSIRHIALAHTLNDQAETVILGLARGSGARSIAGIWPISNFESVVLLHPLLEISRAQTESFCRDAGVDFWDDPHNDDPTFTRVRVRKSVLPTLEKELGPGVIEALGRTAQLMQIDVDHLTAEANQAYLDCVTHAPTSLEISLVKLQRLPAAISSRVVLQALRLFSQNSGSVHVAAVLELSTDWHGQKPLALPGVRVERTGENLVFKSTKTLKSGAC